MWDIDFKQENNQLQDHVLQWFLKVQDLKNPTLSGSEFMFFFLYVLIINMPVCTQKKVRIKLFKQN